MLRILYRHAIAMSPENALAVAQDLTVFSQSGKTAEGDPIVSSDTEGIVAALQRGQPARSTSTLLSVSSSMAARTPSRPMPESRVPPYG